MLNDPEVVKTEKEQQEQINTVSIEKPKKARTEAQLLATQRMVEATRLKRENKKSAQDLEEQKKQEMEKKIMEKIEAKILKKAIKLKSRNNITKMTEQVLDDLDDEPHQPILEKSKIKTPALLPAPTPAPEPKMLFKFI
jgi:hypothetical protein